MHKTLILVRNLESPAQSLDFGEFIITTVGVRFSELREVFSSGDIHQGDWVFEKSYPEMPLDQIGDRVRPIQNNVEDILLLLRLFKRGDISFIRQAIIPQNGAPFLPLPYRAMNDLNSYCPPLFKFKISPEECASWRAFADGIRERQSWRSDWFEAARRFFLSGGAKPFNLKSDDVDRIVDYATALEATLVPERDYNTKRVSHRAGAVIAQGGLDEEEAVVKIVKRLYDIRSQIVHGSPLGDKNRKWLAENFDKVETVVRQILVAAVQTLPPGEKDRGVELEKLYDLADKDRGKAAVDKFREIRTEDVRKATAGEITRLVGA